MSEPGTLSEKIAASVEDVKALLADNRLLSIAVMWRRIQDSEAGCRERFRALDRSRDKRISSLEEAVETLTQRLHAAGVVCRELREELDKLKEATD